MRPWRLAGPASGTWVALARCTKSVDLDGVPDREDVRVGGLQVLVDPDAAARPDLQPGIDRQLVLRPHAHAQDDQLGGQAFAGLQADRQAVRPAARSPRRSGRAAASTPLLARCRERWASSSPRRTAAASARCFSTTVVAMPRWTKFSANSRPMNPPPTTTACLTPPSTSSLIRSVSCEVAQREHAGQVDAGNRRADRGRPGGEDQLVVGFFVLPPRGQVADADRLRPPVDGLDRRSASARRAGSVRGAARAW